MLQKSEIDLKKIPVWLAALDRLFNLESKLLLDDNLTSFTGELRLKSRKQLERISTPVFLAHAVLNLEKQILCENYQSTFVHAAFKGTNTLESWRDRLRKPDIAFTSIAAPQKSWHAICALLTTYSLLKLYWKTNFTPINYLITKGMSCIPFWDFYTAKTWRHTKLPITNATNRWALVDT